MLSYVTEKGKSRLCDKIFFNDEEIQRTRKILKEDHHILNALVSATTTNDSVSPYYV